MREAKIVVSLIQRQLLPQAILALAERADPSPNRGYILADGQVEAFHECRIDLPTAGSQNLLDGLKRAEHDPVSHADQAPAAYGLDDLSVEQLWEWHPARLGGRVLGLPARWLHPLAEMGEERCGVLLEAVGQEERHTARGQPLDDLMDYSLRHGQRAVTDIDHHQQLARGVHGRPHPGR